MCVFGDKYMAQNTGQQLIQSFEEWQNKMILNYLYYQKGKNNVVNFKLSVINHVEIARNFRKKY